MKLIFITSAVLLLVQVCTSTTVEYAENKLKELHGLMNKKIDEALAEHSKLLRELDEVARTTKQLGLEDIQKRAQHFINNLRNNRHVTYKCQGSREDLFNNLKQLHSADLARCVDQQNNQGVVLLSAERLDLVESVSNAIYQEEKHIVRCGKNVHCLDSTIGNIKEKVYQVVKSVNEEIGNSKQNKQRQEQLIKECARRSVANAERALENVPMCNY